MTHARDHPHRANAQQPKLYVGMILILIFAEALALYGLIGAVDSDVVSTVSQHLLRLTVGIILASKATA